MDQTKERKTLTLEEFKLACIYDEELTDEQVNVLMKMVVLESEEEVLEFCVILHKYRPALEKKFAAELREKKAMVMVACELNGSRCNICGAFVPEGDFACGNGHEPGHQYSVPKRS